jgi:D-alanyl-D-alanine endopeptidase (penicillin-binding protein 7)
MEELNIQSVWIASLGWSLLHFLWQGVAIALVAAVCLLIAGRARSQMRYVINCLALCSCPIWFGMELLSQLQLRAQSQAATTVIYGQHQISAMPQIDSYWGVLVELQTWLSMNLSIIVFIWCCAIFILGLRILMGWCWLRSFQTNQRGKFDPVWQNTVDGLALRLQITRNVSLRLVDSLQSPVTMGLLKPFILLPTSLISGMPTPMIEALLAHELAHIRRHDYVINFLQNLIELILFYHPAVWWLSKNIRIEREYIADEIASQVLAQPRQLALALKELEAFQFYSSQLSIAAHGGHLMSRISRLVKPEVKSSNWKAALLVVSVGFMCLKASAQSGVFKSDEVRQSVEKPQLIDSSNKINPKLPKVFIDFAKEGCQPEYPRKSLRFEEQGVTRLRVLVDKEGVVEQVEILKSSGFESLDEAVQNKLLSPKCKVKPAMLNGVAVQGAAMVDYKWVLH